MESDEARFANDELVKAFVEAMNIERDQDAMIFSELKDMLGIGTNKLRKNIRRLLKDNVIEAVKVDIVDCVGRRTKTWGYRLKR